MSKWSNTISHENYSFLPPYLLLFISGLLFIPIIVLAKPGWLAVLAGGLPPSMCGLQGQGWGGMVGEEKGDETQAELSTTSTAPPMGVGHA